MSGVAGGARGGGVAALGGHPPPLWPYVPPLPSLSPPFSSLARALSLSLPLVPSPSFLRSLLRACAEHRGSNRVCVGVGSGLRGAGRHSRRAVRGGGAGGYPALRVPQRA
eukprot:2693078-Rhodomonas_salina.1